MTLDSKLARTDGADVIRDIRQDISRVRTQIQQVRDKGQDFAKARELRTELRELGKDLRVREARVLGNLLDSAAVILATTTGAGDRVLAQARPFDWVVIDEAAQALEAACWIPILKGAKLVLAGDDKQLPPTIKSDEAAKVFFFLLSQTHSDNRLYCCCCLFVLLLLLLRKGFLSLYLSGFMPSLASGSQECSLSSTV